MKRFSTALVAALLLGALSSARGQYVEDSIDVGSAWVGSMAYNPNVDVVYGISESGGYVFAIDCQSNTVVSQVPSPNPLNIVFNSTENKAYVTVYNSVACDSVLVVNGASHGRIRTIPVRGATDLVWDSASNRVYVSCDDQWDVKVIDCATDSVIAVIRVGDGPLKMHINTRRRKLYVQNYDSRDLSVIDLTTNQVDTTFPMGQYPLSGWYNAVVDKYLIGGYDSRLRVVDGLGDSIVAVTRLPDAANLPAVTGDEETGVAWTGVAGYGQNSVVAVCPHGDTMLGRAVVTGTPEFVYWSKSSRLLYALMYPTGVAVCRVDPLQVVRTLSVQSAPFVAAYSPPTRRLYVGHLNSRLVYVIKDSVTALAEGRAELPSHPVLSTVVRGEVDLPASGVMRQASGVLLDAAGRRVAELRPGRNDVSRLSPGVYFVRTAATPVRRVVLVR